jgi:GT2 family glycosyltransferase
MLSVVIPTYRRPELLARCLHALSNQSLAPDAYEILVADDAASDVTRAQVEGIASSVKPGLRYLPVRGSHGPAAARNVGWRAAQGEVIAFTDDDTIPDRDWLAAGLRAFEADPGLAAVTGRTEVPLPPEPTDYERNESGLATAAFITANCFVLRSALEEVGGFDERFRAAWREDSDLHFALEEAGLKIVRVPEAVVVHPVRPAPWGVSLWQQKKARYEALLYDKHPRLYRQWIRPDCPWDYYGILAALAGGITAGCSGAWPLAAAALGVWLLLTGRFLVRRQRGTSKRFGHVAEMVVTSMLIPPLSVFWRLYGAVERRRVFL